MQWVKGLEGLVLMRGGRGSQVRDGYLQLQLLATALLPHTDQMSTHLEATTQQGILWSAAQGREAAEIPSAFAKIIQDAIC